jgi:ATP-dependent DNA ligase
MAPVLCLKPPERRTFVIDMSPTQTTRSAAPDARKPQINGELVCWNDERVDFAALQRRLHPSQPRAQELAVAMPAAYVVFDILALAGTTSA